MHTGLASSHVLSHTCSNVLLLIVGRACCWLWINQSSVMSQDGDLCDGSWHMVQYGYSTIPITHYRLLLMQSFVEIYLISYFIIYYFLQPIKIKTIALSADKSISYYFQKYFCFAMYVMIWWYSEHALHQPDTNYYFFFQLDLIWLLLLQW